MNKGILVVLAALVAASALIAGCGGSDDDASGSGPAALTKAQYIKKANAICDKGSTATVAGYDAFYNKHPVSEGRELTKAQEIELVRSVIIPNVGEQARQLDALPAPGGDEDEITAFVNALNEAVETIESDPLSFFGPEASNPLLPAVKKAGEYGISHCGAA